MTCDYANTHFAVFNLKSVDYLVKFIRHVEKQETEMKQKLEMETENGNWKLKTEMETQPFHCCSPSKIQLLSQCSPCLQFLLC